MHNLFFKELHPILNKKWFDINNSLCFSRKDLKLFFQKMTNKQKIIIIASWFLLIPLFIFLFNGILKEIFPQISEETKSLISFLGAISLSAFLLDLGFKKLVISKQKAVNQVHPQIPQSANELFIFYLNEWNIYNLSLFGKQNTFSFLSQQKIEWILPLTDFQLEEKTQLLKRVKMANQKLYMIKDDPKLKKIFIKNIENLFQEKKIDYAVLLQNKASFEKAFPAERYEILETRDLLVTILDQIESFVSPARRKKLEKELVFEDKILKEATKKPFELSLPSLEIQMRPKTFWWWKTAQNEKNEEAT